jgi:recombination protein RecT
MNEISQPQAAATDARSLAAPLPAKHSFKPLKECKTLEEAFATHEFMERIQASTPQHVQPGRMLRTFVSAVSKTPLLAQVSLRSFLGACLTCSQVGLEPNTPLGHIWLLPFKTKIFNPETRKRDKEVVEVNTIFGYPGLLDLSYRTTKVKAIHADVVWPGDEFSFEYGTDAHLRHRPRAHKPDDRPLYAYMHAGLDGGQAFEVMPYDDVLAIRNKSQAYRFALSSKEDAEAKGWNVPRSWTDAPWVQHEIAMARKTAFRAGSKWLPRSVELAAVIAIDEAQDRRRHMDFSTVMDAPTIDGTPDYLGAAADAAGQSDEDAERASEEAQTTTRTQVTVNKPTGPSAAEIAKNKAATVKEQNAAGDRARAAREASLAADAEALKQTTADKPMVAETRNWDEPSSYYAQGFEAVLIDAAGDVTSEPFTDPVAFARAFLLLWHDSGPNGDTLREYNEDALAEALNTPEAATLLTVLDADPASDVVVDQPVEQKVAPPIVVVQPPIERGKPGWASYLKLLKAALMQDVDAGNFGQWAAAQRETLEKCPMAQRVLAIRAISETAGMRRVDQPLWLGDLVRGKPAVAPSESKAAEPKPAGEAPVKSSDERWVEARLAELQTCDRDQFDQLAGSQAVRTVMARLRRENEPLFNIADHAFTAKHNELPPAKG